MSPTLFFDTETYMSGKNQKWLAENLPSAEPNGCLLWPFPPDAHGYGRLNHEGRKRFAHQVALELAGFPRPTAEYSEAAHSCDVRKCVNPFHLRWATKKQNRGDQHVTHCPGCRC